MEIPGNIRSFLQEMERAGFAAYLVGGCVRDMQMGKAPHDWDVTTSARPEQVLSHFGGYAIPTGLQHGTVTVLWQEAAIEVTTFRRESAYRDHRHPDAVTFADTLREDLSRRDFTVNAMAMDGRGVITDPFGGAEDLRRGLLRCVGEPRERFREDALRIMRCLRFAAVLGFSIEEKTAAALREQKDDLRFISPERLRDELCKLLCGDHVANILLGYPDVLGVFLPDILPSVGFDQRNFHHVYNVWEHTVRTVAAAPKDVVVRLTMLLHDLGKPAAFTVDEKGVGHFYGHARLSGEIARRVCRRLRLDNDTARRVITLVEWHDREVQCTPAAVRRALHRLGEQALRDLAQVKRADNLAQAPAYRSRLSQIDGVMALMESLLAQDACFSLRQLAVNGRDMMDLGLRGPDIGAMLRYLLEQVLDGAAPNEHAVLLALAEKKLSAEKG